MTQFVFDTFLLHGRIYRYQILEGKIVVDAFCEETESHHTYIFKNELIKTANEILSSEMKKPYIFVLVCHTSYFDPNIHGMAVAAFEVLEVKHCFDCDPISKNLTVLFDTVVDIKNHLKSQETP